MQTRDKLAANEAARAACFAAWRAERAEVDAAAARTTAAAAADWHEAAEARVARADARDAAGRAAWLARKGLPGGRAAAAAALRTGVQAMATAAWRLTKRPETLSQ
jgi:hypothetical protein